MPAAYVQSNWFTEDLYSLWECVTQWSDSHMTETSTFVKRFPLYNLRVHDLSPVWKLQRALDIKLRLRKFCYGMRSLKWSETDSGANIGTETYSKGVGFVPKMARKYWSSRQKQ